MKQGLPHLRLQSKASPELTLADLIRLAKGLVDQALEAYAARGDAFAALAKLQAAQRVLAQTFELLLSDELEATLKNSELTPKERKLLGIVLGGGS